MPAYDLALLQLAYDQAPATNSNGTPNHEKPKTEEPGKAIIIGILALVIIAAVVGGVVGGLVRRRTQSNSELQPTPAQGGDILDPTAIVPIPPKDYEVPSFYAIEDTTLPTPSGYFL
ncbi:hypothetical protein AX16_007356 [Volvariella volvacea WC 439]|nr:hypothetical protein AX16_007356 [Volvariella volvacea WC 439]